MTTKADKNPLTALLEAEHAAAQKIKAEEVGMYLLSTFVLSCIIIILPFLR